MSTNTFLVLIWLHFLSDFPLQMNRMALQKSVSNRWLAIHCLVYGVPFLLFGWKFALANGAIHAVIDFSTSRWNAKLGKLPDKRYFFWMIGFDQAAHMTSLVLTYPLARLIL